LDILYLIYNIYIGWFKNCQGCSDENIKLDPIGRYRKIFLSVWSCLNPGLGGDQYYPSKNGFSPLKQRVGLLGLSGKRDKTGNLDNK